MTTRLGIAAMCRNMHEYLEWIEVTESCGYYLAGYGDTQNLLPDPFVALTAMAMMRLDGPRKLARPTH